MEDKKTIYKQSRQTKYKKGRIKMVRPFLCYIFKVGVKLKV